MKTNYKKHEGIDRNTVYVSNLSYLRDRAGVQELFRPYGEVIHVKIVMNKETDRPTGMAFVEMKTAKEADIAIAELDGQSIDGRILKANRAIPQKKKSAGKSKAKEEVGRKKNEKKYEKLSKDSMSSKEAKAKRRKESGLGRLQLFLDKNKKK